MGLLQKIKSRIVRLLSGGALPSHFAFGPIRDQNWVNLFQGNWASHLPLPDTQSGNSDLFHDPRITWFLQNTPAITGKSILELGPLEGAHSSMLQSAGAASVTAIEANGLAWLKCLAVKERMGMDRCHFLYGDFLSYLDTPGPSFDAAIACGILYHLKDPHLLFQRLQSRCLGPIFLWTMVWRPEIQHSHPRLHKNFRGQRQAILSDGKPITLHRHEYGQSLWSKGFWGGNDTYAEWLSKEDLQASIEAAGYQIQQWGFEEMQHPNGPALAAILIPAQRG